MNGHIKRIEKLEKTISKNTKVLMELCFYVEIGKRLSPSQKKIVSNFKTFRYGNGIWYWPKQLTIDDIIIDQHK